ncbi:hypothetical protein UFOVP138_25 [uncultured Caudovirales phage]|uniref:Uncharacterized protein n=1 Tax=uncultured Caudovirales phage TaxID=2100421 RepID=A0A6J5LBZ7_9CAUD|nr:hypothetical protein UFOVP138_25 [uncultured Caudovirales phage]
MENNIERLKLLRVPFEAHQISRLPKPTKKQTDDLKADFKIGIRCKECGTWHHKDVVHLNYVGHAALTDRLLDVDPTWNWKPVSAKDGHPILDSDGGMWIELTVCGVTRLGYGDAQGKTGGNATKERIGDALRNAAMRFGAALDLWHKGDLHGGDDVNVESETQRDQQKKEKKPLPEMDKDEVITRYGTDVVDGESGEVTRFSKKAIIQKGEAKSQTLIDFLAPRCTLTESAIKEIKSWEKK